MYVVLLVVATKGHPEAAVQSHQLKIDTKLNKRDTNIHIIKHLTTATADDNIKIEYYCQTQMDHLMLVIMGGVTMSNHVILMTVS